MYLDGKDWSEPVYESSRTLQDLELKPLGVHFHKIHSSNVIQEFVELHDIDLLHHVVLGIIMMRVQAAMSFSSRIEVKRQKSTFIGQSNLMNPNVSKLIRGHVNPQDPANERVGLESEHQSESSSKP